MPTEPDLQALLAARARAAGVTTDELLRQLLAGAHQQASPAPATTIEGIGNIAASGQAIVLNIAGSVFGNVQAGNKTAKETQRKASALLANYLDGVLKDCSRVRLESIDEGEIGCSDQHLQLQHVYIRLLVTATDAPEDCKSMDRHFDRETQHLSAAQFAARNDHAVFLGLPGGGKTTFTDHLCLCFAGEIRQHPSVNLKLLSGDWSAPAPLPLRIVLREYAAQSLPKKRSLWQHLCDTAWADLHGLDKLIQRHLVASGGLLILDGLDEISETTGCRDAVRKAITDFQTAFPKVRLLVTCRTYAYQRPEWRLQGFAVTELAPFTEAEWNPFISQWYDEVARVRRSLSAEQAKANAAELQSTIAGSRQLPAMAERPLLLTLMAALHSLRGGKLPEKRQALYQASVSLLLTTWERPKKMFNEKGQPTVESRSFREFLGLDDRDKLEEALAKLAYEVHQAQGHKSGVADIAEGDLLAALAPLRRKDAPDDKTNCAELASYLHDRAGLITHAAPGVYQFPHRTFQEYMAAVHLCKLGSAKIAEHLRENPNLWREAYLLAGAKSKQGLDEAVWNIAHYTCCAVPPLDASPNDWLCAGMAGKLIDETQSQPANPAQQNIRSTIIASLVAILTQGQLDPVERAAAGVTLGHLGDPRPGVCDFAGMDDCNTGTGFWSQLIEPGPFPMGNDATHGRNDYEQPRHRCTAITKGFVISRHLITVQQYQGFIDDRGYATQKWWSATGWAWNEEQEKRGPRNYGGMFETPNHPRVGVCWHEAMAFCKWLSDKRGVAVRLPTEAEWERAARHTDARKFAWPDHCQDKPEWLANIYETGIGSTSAVGLFPAGKAECGALDMTGNVWEWTGSPWTTDYRAPKYDEASAVAAAEGSSRASRGGAWYGAAEYCTAANRYWYDPSDTGSNLGFRLASVPA